MSKPLPKFCSHMTHSNSTNCCRKSESFKIAGEPIDLCQICAGTIETYIKEYHVRIKACESFLHKSLVEGSPKYWQHKNTVVFQQRGKEDGGKWRCYDCLCALNNDISNNLAMRKIIKK